MIYAGETKMLRLLPFLFALIALCGFPGPGIQTAPLVTAFVEAMNHGDDAHLTAFVKQWCSDSIPVADRVSRLKNIAQQGAPFTVVDVDATKSRITLVLKDKNGEQLGLRIELTADGKYDRAMAGPPDALNAPPPKDYTGWKNLDSLAEAIRKDTDCPAIGIGVIEDGKLEVAVAGTRTAEGKDAVGADEPWSVGSIGKPICSTIIGKLIELGKLRWDTTVGEAFAGVAMKPGYKDVTIEQIMHHRGGIPEDPGMRKPDVDRIVAGATDRRKMRENYAEDILGRDPIAKPDTRFAYSNAGYVLLGVIAERVTGKIYESLVRDLVFDPLNLKHSYTGEDKLPEARPHGHVRGPQGLQEMNVGGPLEILFAPAGGGINMSLADLARFGQAHLDGLLGKDGLLKADTIKRLHQGVPEDSPAGRKYACGWGIEQGGAMHTHNGSNGTMRAQLAIFPALHLVVSSFVNAGGESEPSPPLQAALAVAKRYMHDR